MTVVVHKRPRRRKVPTLAELQAEIDIGPAIQNKAIKAPDGTVVREARLEMAERECPDDPQQTTKGARVRVLYREWHANGGITLAQRDAAERYAAMCEALHGSSTVHTRYEEHIRAPQSMQTGHPGFNQVQAAAGLRAVHKLVGPKVDGLLRFYVRDNESFAEIGKRMGLLPRDVSAAVRDALAQCAKLWRMG